MESEVRDNPEEQRFELVVDGQRAEAFYRVDGKVITFMHTDVPKVLEGRGVASRLLAGALALVRARGLKVRAECPFAQAYLKKHTEYADLLV